jgi:hypothetical protein
MLKRAGMFLICVTMFQAFGQSSSKYQVGTITEVKVHQAAGSGASDAVSYDVSVKVGNIIYVVLYTPPLGEETVKYAGGVICWCSWGKTQLPTTTYWVDHLRYR